MTVKPVPLPPEYADRIAGLMAAIHAVEAEFYATLTNAQLEESCGFLSWPADLRWKAHVLACSLKDSTFWIRKIADGTFLATEVETGTSASGATEREAIENYYAENLG